ncbi:hypothetical protein PCANB_001861 [Pneumocystis canis]|nr:hypothetical protein PCANB_001861 [Pneumocystis canis]
MSVKDVQALQEVLRGTNYERKIETLVGLKRFIKRNDVSLESVPLLLDGLRMGLISANSLVAMHSLTCLGHLIKRVVLQDTGRLKTSIGMLLPLLIEKLGDMRDKAREIALNTLIELWKVMPIDVERGMKELGFTSKIWRTREHSLYWLLKMYQTQMGFSFRSLTPLIIKMLEDANDSVRDAAKDVIIELFKNASNHTKNDLKRELIEQHVRKKLVLYILDQLQLQADNDFASSRGSEYMHDNDTTNTSIRKMYNESIAGTSNFSSNYILNLSGAEMEQMDPAWVYSAKELETEIQEMLPSFEGKETDNNWVIREKHIMRLRALLRGNVYKEYSSIFITGFKLLVDGIIKAINSLRTTLSLSGLQFIKDVAIVVGPAIDQSVEVLLNNLIRVTGLTKKIISQAAQVTVSVLIANVSYHPKIVQQLLIASQDKNPSIRQYAAGWLRTLLEAHIDSRTYMENSGGLDIMEKAIKNGISDANSVVRTGMRDVLRCFSEIWPDRTQSLILSLDPVSRKQFEKVFQNFSISSKSVNGYDKCQNLSQSISSNRGKTFVKEPLTKTGGATNKKANDVSSIIHGLSGLSSGPIRHGLGLPQRHGYPSKITVKKPESPIHDQPVSSTTLNQGHVSPIQMRNEVSPKSMLTATSLFGKPLLGVSRSSPRKLTIIEQLLHPDWRTRVDGIITVACLLAKKVPPNYDNQKLPSLPPNDILASTFQKILNDSQPEVVNHLMAPEVIVEIAKIIPLENIVPRILLLSEMDDTERGHDIVRSCLPAVKKMISDADAAELLSKVLTSMGVSGVVPKKLSACIFTTSQKRKIIHGVLLWMNELVERHNESIKNGEEGNSYFNDISNFKFYVNRLVPMINNTKPISVNYGPLAALLKSLQIANEDVFDKVLQTFEKVTVNALKNAWGITVEEESHVVQEKVACIEDVLGSIPMVSHARLDDNGIEQHSSSSLESHSIKYSDAYVDPFEENIGAQMNFEDMTMIQIPKFHVNHSNNKASGGLSASSDPSIFASADSTLTIQDATRNDDLKSLDNKVDQIEHDLPIQFFETVPALDSEKQGNPDILIKDESFSKDSSLWFHKYMRSKLDDIKLNDIDVLEHMPIIPLPKTIDDNIKLLNNLIERLENHDMDSYAFRKLMCISKEYNLELDTEKSDDVFDDSKKEDVWVSGNLFDSLLNALLDFMTEGSISELKIQALLLLKYLFDHQKLYFSNHILTVLDYLLRFRSNDSNSSRVTCVIEEMIFDIAFHFEPKEGVTMFLSYLEPYVTDTADELREYFLKQPIIVICLSCLAIFIKKLEKSQLNQYLEKIPLLIIKALNDKDPEIRKESVAICVSINSVIKNSLEIFDLLQGLTNGFAFQKRYVMSSNFLMDKSKNDEGIDTFEFESKISAKLHALHARLKLESLFPKSTLVRTFIDSRVTLGMKFASNNESLSVLGMCIIKYFVSEYLMARWPRLPSNILKTVMWGYCGSKALAKMGREWGIEMSDKEVKVSQDSTEDELRSIFLEILSEAKNGKLVFKRIGWMPDHTLFLRDDYKEIAISRIGLTDVRVFIDNHIISRHISMPSLFSFEQPTRELSVLCSRQKLESPVSRLIAETGRHSISPLFIVGVYSGNEKLGEGYGSSLKEAKHTASIDALKAWYLYESRDFDRPSKTLENDKEMYIPVHIDCGEVIV